MALRKQGHRQKKIAQLDAVIKMRDFPVKPDGTVVDVTLWATSLALALDVISLLVDHRRAPGLSLVSEGDAGVVSASLVSNQNDRT